MASAGGALTGDLLARYDSEAAARAPLAQSALSTWQDALARAAAACDVEEASALASAYASAQSRREAAVAALRAALADVAAAEAAARAAHEGAQGRLASARAVRQEALRAAHGEEVAALRADHAADAAAAAAAHDALCLELRHLGRAVAEECARAAGEAEAEAAQVREHERRRGLERLHTLQTDMDAAFDVIEKLFQGEHHAYELAFRAKTEEFQRASAEGQRDANELRRQRRAARRLERRTDGARARLAHLAREADARDGALARERDIVAGLMHALSRAAARAAADGEARLRTLALAASSVRGELSGQLRLADRILAAAEATRALEPPPPPPMAPRAVQATLRRLLGDEGFAADDAAAPPASLTLRPPSSGGVGGSRGGMRRGSREQQRAAAAPHLAAIRALAEEPTLMRCFYERFNAALADKLALEEALAEARRDRAALQAALDTCSALSALRPDALDAPNVLLVVNGRTGLPPRAPPPPRGGRA